MPSMYPLTLKSPDVHSCGTESRIKMANDDHDHDHVVFLSVSIRVCGSYADMNAGLPSEACKDFSGGVHITHKLGDAHAYGHDEELWLQLNRATGCKSMICCGTAPKGVRVKFKENKRRKQRTSN